MAVHRSGRPTVPVIYQSTDHCEKLGKMLDGVMQGAISVAEDLQVYMNCWSGLVPDYLLSSVWNETRVT